MSRIIFEKESYEISGICMEIHRVLGIGFKEPVYKDAMSIEFAKAFIPFEREKKFDIEYKGIILIHKFFADFVAYHSIILEIKVAPFIIDRFVAQTINYLKASGMKLGIIINFGERSLTYKRIIF
jgi:GxxExxY protein